MRLLFLGDVVGRTGRRAVIEHLPKLRERYALDFVIVNGEIKNLPDPWIYGGDDNKDWQAPRVVPTDSCQ